MTTRDIHRLMESSLFSLETEEGILASAREEAFGAIFGRDTAITVIEMLRVYSRRPHPRFLTMAERSLRTLISLQGRDVNLESGEEPGKFIHEFRRDRFDHLVKEPSPWFIYPDGTLKNYDSLDSTPLVLIALYRYFETTGDERFLNDAMESARRGLEWVIHRADKDGDGFLEFTLDPERQHGGLAVQSWTDSRESFMDIEGQLPAYPIAPVEIQAYTWLALRLWSRIFVKDVDFYQILSRVAGRLQEEFIRQYLFKDQGLWFAAQALDGNKNQIRTITANPLLCLWASDGSGNDREAIVPRDVLAHFVERSFRDDLFDPASGIRTMSAVSPTYRSTRDSYHNGSFWPMLNGLIYQGLMDFGFWREALRLKRAALRPIRYFKMPIELYLREGKGYCEYLSPSGQTSCRTQAWSAASLLSMVSSRIPRESYRMVIRAGASDPKTTLAPAFVPGSTA